MLAAAEHTDSSLRTSKRRLACERCRDQKLRCIRRDANDREPCVRCLQAQAECIVSLRKTPGRPAGRSNLQGQQHHRGTRDGPDTRRSGQLTNSTAYAALDPGLDSSHGSIISEDLLEIPSDFSLDDWAGDPTAASAAAAATATLFSPRSGSSAMCTQDLSDSLFKYPDLSTDLPLTWSSSSAGSSSIMRRRPSSVFHTQDQDLDPGFQQKFSRQLLLLQSLSWDIPSVMKLGSGPYSCSRQPSEESSQEFNPLTSTFEVISEFEHQLNTARSMITRRKLQATPSFRQEMNVSYSLTAVSCYLQLVCIYDCIFSYILSQTSSNPVARDFILHSTPEVSLGGFVVPSPKNSCGKLFVQLMQLKIKPIEAALGLPGDVCVSGDHECCDGIPKGAGLLGGKQGEPLLAALKESAAGDPEDTNTSEVIRAVRDQMIRLESFE